MTANRTEYGDTDWEAAERVVGLLDGRWTLRLLAQLRDGPQRYRDLFDSLESISHKVLTETLRRIERDGFLSL